MKNPLLIIVLTTAVCLTGCKSFISSSPKAMKQSGAPVAQSMSAPTDSAPIIPDLPALEPVQTAPTSTPVSPAGSHAVSHSAPQSNVENPFANGGKLASLEDLKPNEAAASNVSNEPAIKVVRLPKTEAVPKKTSEIQQVSYEEPEPELAPLPSSPEALNVASTQTVPKDHWNGANNVTPETQPVKPNELTMTPTVLDVDKKPGTIETDSPDGEKKDGALPKPMNGSKPMDSGVYLEELPSLETDDSQTPSQPTGGNSSQDIPDEVFDAPGTPNGSVNNAAPANASASNVVIEPSELEEALDSPTPIKQCAAIAPIEEKFQIKSLTFVTSIRKLGDFTAVNQPYEFTPGQTLLLYMEFDNPNAITNLRSGFEVKDSQGKQITSQDNESSVPAEDKTFFQYVKLALPADVESGEYTIRVWGQPEGEQNVSASTLKFQVK